ncbi:glutathione S-transferase family protein [Leeia oryzae]|uniref:glutathione S-transferase family protein n=1 Tax=Leeia oryzae TaxID=356662 RepID=UPI00036CFC40|nr:glutathione S-transferase family protein [Leeia oryzae]
MKLIGMLDSPYVRRVAVSLQLLGLPFEHQAVSVFRHFPTFQSINPVVKAPTLVCDDGEVLMDSNLILEYAELLAAPDKRLWPTDLKARQHAIRLTGLALVMAEKSVTVVYERLRPADKQYASWIERSILQLTAALDQLEAELARAPLSAAPGQINQAGISIAVCWYFAEQMLPDIVKAADYPAIAALSAAAEALDAFKAAPYGDGTYPHR